MSTSPPGRAADESGGMVMEQQLRTVIEQFVGTSPGNRFPDGSAPYFDTPLVGTAAADDPLFTAYKTVIGPFHLTPREVLAASCGETAVAATVISWVLPITRPTRESNRREERFPSKAWAETRSYGEQVNAALRKHLTGWLEGKGYRAVAPQLSPAWRELADAPVGIASTWSERHAAYAAGLGTFSLNDALITPRGIAHRCGSVVTDLALPASPRPYADHRCNCLYYRNGSCGLCVARCPAGALSLAGHDKKLCREYVYGTVPAAVGEAYGVPNTGCGLCQTRVPCEQSIPS